MRRNDLKSMRQHIVQTLTAAATPLLGVGLLAALLLSHFSTSWGSAFSAFGPENFLRSTGAPIQEVRTFTVRNPGLYVLRLYNGGLISG